MITINITNPKYSIIVIIWSMWSQMPGLTKSNLIKWSPSYLHLNFTFQVVGDNRQNILWDFKPVLLN